MAEDQVALVTGASRGIGRYLAGHLVARGFTVIGLSRSEPPPLDSPNYVHLIADVGIEANVTAAFRVIRAQFGRLDVVINNAAIFPPLSLLLLTSSKAATETFTTNVLGTIMVSREGAKLMMRRRWGRIINFSSMAVRHEMPGEAIYSASKAAIHSLTRVMAKEFYPHGITCNVVAPSAIGTDMMAAVPADALKDVLARNAIPHFGKMEDVSNTVDWLIRPESQSITGQTIFLGGA